jgi:D-3-phosphoglycerate dehydrogenase
MTVLAYDPFVSEQRAAELGVTLVSMESLLGDSDTISLHLPRNEETEGLVNHSLLHKMKKGVNLINCSRGGIVVESDLVRALDEGWVGAAGVDVHLTEPPQDLSLIRHPRVVATPHIGASTDEAQITVAEMIARQMGLFLTGGEAVNVLNPEAIQ